MFLNHPKLMSMHRSSSGRSFQILGPATVKSLSPKLCCIAALATDSHLNITHLLTYLLCHHHHTTMCAGKVCYLQADVPLAQHSSALLKLSEWPPASVVPPPEPRDVSAQLSWGCSSLDEAPSCSVSAHTQHDETRNTQTKKDIVPASYSLKHR